MSDTHVESDECFVYILEYHSVEQLSAEVQTSCRRRYGTFVFCEDGLEVFCILRSYFLSDPVRDRSLSQSELCVLEVLIASVIKETECSSS